MKTALFVCVALATILLVACQDPPLPTTPTADNPCGEAYIPCLDMSGKLDGLCCDENETCGGGKYSVGCPANSCCDIDDPPPMGVASGATVEAKVVHVKHPKLRKTRSGGMEFVTSP